MTSTPPLRDAHDLLQGVVDEVVSPGVAAPAGCVMGIDVAGARTVVVAGNASPERSAPMQRGTLFDLASVTKVVGTTACLHRLASQKALDVDTEVRSMVPTYGGTPTTTVRDLLQHRGGLWEWQPLYLAPGGSESPHGVIDALPLRYPAGRERHYSDLGFMTLGRVVAAVTGHPLDVAVRELVTAPLGLEPLLFGPVDGDVATSGTGDGVERRMVATGDPYPVLWDDDGFRWRTGPTRGEVNDCNSAHAFQGVSGHAGLFSSVDALLDFGTALASADDFPSLWDAAVTADFFNPGPDREQALGWRRSNLHVGDDRLPLLWHPGFTGVAMGFVPDRHITLAIGSNRLLADQPQPTTALWTRAVSALTEILKDQGVTLP